MESNPLGLSEPDLALIARSAPATVVFRDLESSLSSYLEITSEASRLQSDPSFDSERFGAERMGPSQRALIVSMDRLSAWLPSIQDQADLFGLLHAVLSAIEPYFAQIVVSYHLARVRTQHHHDRPYERVYQESILLLERVLRQNA